MALLERRIGLLFAAFLALLLLAAGRALFLGTIKGSSLSNAAASQQVSSLELPARRGTIVDRHGFELAVSEPADDVSATPYLVKDPARTAAKLAPLLGVDPDTLLRKLAKRDSTFAYLARSVPASQGTAVQKLELPGIQTTAAHRRVYPRQYLASQLLGSVGTDGNGLSGLEYADDKLLQGTDGERRLVKDALGESLSIRDTKPAKPGSRLELTIDAAIQDKVERVLADVGATYRPHGATAIVMNPAHRRGAGDGQLAAHRRQRAGRRAQLRHAEPRRGLHLRAGLDLQGLHRRGRAAGRHGHAEHAVRPAAADPGRRPDDRRVASARARDADHGADPRAVLERRRDQDRPGDGQAALRLLGAQVRLRQAHGRRPARRGARPRAARRQVLGLLDGQPADRPGPAR